MYKNKFVNDLHYAIFSESLLEFDQSIHNLLFGIDEKMVLDWLKFLDNNDGQLTDFIYSNNSIRLGKYFENLVHFYLNWNENVQIIDYSKQFYKDKATIGEIDFLIFDKIRREYLHIEVAVKFFVKWPNHDGYADFICPNGQRNLKSKLDKTFSKQLNILENDECIDYLESKKIAKYKSRLLIKGGIFYFEDEKDFSSDELDFNPSHNRFDAQYFDKLNLEENMYFKALMNHDWMSFSFLSSSSDLISYQQLQNDLKQHFSDSTRGCVYGVFKKVEDGFQEQSKIAILHPKWPIFN
jgi:uncharacterized protein